MSENQKSNTSTETPIYYTNSVVAYREVSHKSANPNALPLIGRVFKDVDVALGWADEHRAKLKDQERVIIVPEPGRIEYYDKANVVKIVEKSTDPATQWGELERSHRFSGDIKKYAPYYLSWLQQRGIIKQSYTPIAVFSTQLSYVMYGNWLRASSSVLSFDLRGARNDSLLLHPFGLYGPQFLCLATSSKFWSGDSTGADIAYGYTHHAEKCGDAAARSARRLIIKSNMTLLDKVRSISGASSPDEMLRAVDAIAALPAEVECNYMTWDPMKFNTDEQLATVKLS